MHALAQHTYRNLSTVRELTDYATQILHSHPQRALELVCQAEHMASHSYQVKMLKIKCLFKLRRYANALAVAKQTLQLHKNPECFRQLSAIHFALGNLDEAENYIRIYIQKTNYSGGYAFLAKIYSTRGNGWIPSAKEAIQHAIDICPPKYLWTNKLMQAKILRKAKEYDKALKVLDELDELGPVMLGSLLCRAFCHMESMDYDDAILTLMIAEEKFNKGESRKMFNEGVRIYTGAVFIYDYICQCGVTPDPDIADFAKKAARWIANHNESRLGVFQTRDFGNAQQIIQERNLV